MRRSQISKMAKVKMLLAEAGARGETMMETKQ